MRIVQFEIPDQGRRVGLVDGDSLTDVTAAEPQWQRVVDVFHAAEAADARFEELLEAAAGRSNAAIDYAALLKAEASGDAPFLHPPVDAEDHHLVLLTGTGLTHLGSMKSRDSMHATDKSGAQAPLTDSAKIFQMGIEGGKPPAGERGVAPEWFYKGNGFNLRGHGWTLEVPDFAGDGGEEAELVGCYVIDPRGVPRRLGFALGNEWSDHATERINYLYLAPSKLRQCAVGPELITDFDFQELKLSCNVSRDGEVIYESGELLTGEQHMSHSLANCEDHHFKYQQHRQPGDVHLHYFGTSKLSYGTREWAYRDGDVIEIVPEIGASLRNTVRASTDKTWPTVAVELA